MKLKLTILTLIYCLNSTAQTELNSYSQNFLSNLVISGYSVRGKDVQALHHNTLDASISCIDLGVQTSNIMSSCVLWYPNIGTTLSSQSYNLIDPSSYQITFTGTPTANDGYVGYNGSSQYATTTYSGALGDFTCSVWFNSDIGSNIFFDRIVDKDYVAGFVVCRKDNINPNFWGTYIEDPTASNPIYVTLSEGFWHNIVVTRIGTTATVYGDGGSVVSSGTVSNAILSSASLNIGWSSPTLSYNYFTGGIQDIMIFNRGLNSTEVTNLYNWQLSNLGYANKH